MRISYKVWLVGGIPIAIAAAIAVVAWFLLKEAERARDGVVLAGTIYRNLLVAMTARDDYVQALPGDRAEHAVRFAALAEQARADLAALDKVAGEPSHAPAAVAARDALARYEQRMRQFMVVTTQNDHLAAEMRARVASLITLTDRARERQRASNADIVASLTQKDRKQRAIRDIVDKAQELRAQIAAVSLQELQRNYGTTWDAIAHRRRRAHARPHAAAPRREPSLPTAQRRTSAARSRTNCSQLVGAIRPAGRRSGRSDAAGAGRRSAARAAGQAAVRLGRPAAQGQFERGARAARGGRAAH